MIFYFKGLGIRSSAAFGCVPSIMFQHALVKSMAPRVQVSLVLRTVAAEQSCLPPGVLLSVAGIGIDAA